VFPFVDSHQALFLPEVSDYIASSASESISLCQPASSSPFVQGLCAEARKHQLAINVGVHEPSSEPAAAKLGDEKKKIKNTSLWIDKEGKLEHRYQKLHLFDVEIEGGPILKESEYVKGNSI
jgi:deaminated glutathione amidase